MKKKKLIVEFVRTRPDRSEIADAVCEVLGEILKGMKESLERSQAPNPSEDEIEKLMKEPKAQA